LTRGLSRRSWRPRWPFASPVTTGLTPGANRLAVRSAAVRGPVHQVGAESHRT
jgi:hypothetical protein